MVNGNRLAMRARELLDSAPAPSRDADWQSGYKTGYETGLSDGRAEFTNPAATSPAERAALARAPLPAQGDAPMLWFDPEAVERSRLTDYADSIIISGTSVKFGHNTAPLYAAPAQAGDAQWSKEPPTEQADYWHWDGDEDHAPMIYHVLWSGTAKKCFVSIGQYGIDEAIWCDNFGGYWMKIEQPSVRAAMSASQGKTQEAK
jgi:hypothetical protein